MKITPRKFLPLAIALLTLGSVQLTFAQSASTQVTTTTSAGTISEFGPETIIIRSTTSPEPVRYSYSKTTTYVDETGSPVSLELVKSGVPVTVYYTTVGGQLVASKVVVQRAVVTPVVVPVAAPVIEEKTSTTTTTETTKED